MVSTRSISCDSHLVTKVSGMFQIIGIQKFSSLMDGGTMVTGERVAGMDVAA